MVQSNKLMVSHSRVTITDDIREALKAKRLRLGFSYAKVADCLGVHWSTYRKWEREETTQCTHLTLERMQIFLKDETLTESVKTVTPEHVMDKLMRRQRNLFRLISNDLKRREKFLTRLEALLDDTLEEWSRTTDRTADNDR